MTSIPTAPTKPTRYRHQTIAQYEAKVEARFWSKVNKAETCWLWEGQESTNGYGVYTYTAYSPGRLKTDAKHIETRTHRYAWEKANGPIPEGAEIDHICHTRLCVRPDHLRPATRKQNSENRGGLPINNTTGVRGVRWIPQRKAWRATVGHDGKQIHVGMFRDLAEAEAAVVARRNELHTHNDIDRI